MPDITNRETVLAAYPDAACWVNPDSGQFVILLPDKSDKRRWLELSACWDTSSMAWHDAAAALERKGTQSS